MLKLFGVGRFFLSKRHKKKHDETDAGRIVVATDLQTDEDASCTNPNGSENRDPPAGEPIKNGRRDTDVLTSAAPALHMKRTSATSLSTLKKRKSLFLSQGGLVLSEHEEKPIYKKSKSALDFTMLCDMAGFGEADQKTPREVSVLDAERRIYGPEEIADRKLEASSPQLMHISDRLARIRPANSLEDLLCFETDLTFQRLQTQLSRGAPTTSTHMNTGSKNTGSAGSAGTLMPLTELLHKRDQVDDMMEVHPKRGEITRSQSTTTFLIAQTPCALNHDLIVKRMYSLLKDYFSLSLERHIKKLNDLETRYLSMMASDETPCILRVSVSTILAKTYRDRSLSTDLSAELAELDPLQEGKLSMDDLNLFGEDHIMNHAFYTRLFCSRGTIRETLQLGRALARDLYGVTPQALGEIVYGLFEKDEFKTEIMIVCLVYLCRLQGRIRMLYRYTFKQVLFSLNIMASKVLDDQAIWNTDFKTYDSLVHYPHANKMGIMYDRERFLFKWLGFDLEISKGQYLDAYLKLIHS